MMRGCNCGASASGGADAPEPSAGSGVVGLGATATCGRMTVGRVAGCVGAGATATLGTGAGCGGAVGRTVGAGGWIAGAGAAEEAPPALNDHCRGPSRHPMPEPEPFGPASVNHRQILGLVSVLVIVSVPPDGSGRGALLG